MNVYVFKSSLSLCALLFLTGVVSAEVPVQPLQEWKSDLAPASIPTGEYAIQSLQQLKVKGVDQLIPGAAIDWTRELLLVAVDQPRSTGGYSVMISNIKRMATPTILPVPGPSATFYLEATVTQTSPDSKGPVAHVQSRPVHVVKIRKTPLFNGRVDFQRVVNGRPTQNRNPNADDRSTSNDPNVLQGEVSVRGSIGSQTVWIVRGTESHQVFPGDFAYMLKPLEGYTVKVRGTIGSNAIEAKALVSPVREELIGIVQKVSRRRFQLQVRSTAAPQSTSSTVVVLGDPLRKPAMPGRILTRLDGQRIKVGGWVFKDANPQQVLIEYVVATARLRAPLRLYYAAENWINRGDVVKATRLNLSNTWVLVQPQRGKGGFTKFDNLNFRLLENKGAAGALSSGSSK